MNDLLTTRQVQDIFQVDRITIYRMLQDGRLKGVKIGQQWRFPVEEVERLVNARQSAGEPPAIANSAPVPAAASSALPLHCLQTIQDLFAEISQISAVVVDMDGNLLTSISHPTRFCRLLLETASGQNACRASFQGFARGSLPANGAEGSRFFTCAAGLQYIGAPIFDRGTQVGLFLAGQFYWQQPDPREETGRIRRLAAETHLSFNELMAAAREIPVIDQAQHERVESWPFTAARAMQSILHERSCFMDRLQQIANLTQLS